MWGRSRGHSKCVENRRQGGTRTEIVSHPLGFGERIPSVLQNGFVFLPSLPIGVWTGRHGGNLRHVRRGKVMLAGTSQYEGMVPLIRQQRVVHVEGFGDVCEGLDGGLVSVKTNGLTPVPTALLFSFVKGLQVGRRYVEDHAVNRFAVAGNDVALSRSISASLMKAKTMIFEFGVHDGFGRRYAGLNPRQQHIGSVPEVVHVVY